MIKQHRYRIKQFKLYFGCAVCLTLLVLGYLFARHSAKYEKKHEGFEPAEGVPMAVEPKKVAFVGERIVHLDLKGAPPKVVYYKYLFPLLKQLGATGVLVEYEDMFPYSSELQNITALNSYTIDDVKVINDLAKEHQLKVIPLVQTFGHLEFVLKLPSYKDYREVPEYPQVICPTYEKTEKLIKEMIKQNIEAHPDSTYIHLGADEVYFLGVCDKCVRTMTTNSLDKNKLFITYINNLAKFIKKTYPQFTVLIWDDQLRSITPEVLKTDDFHQNVQPVVWKYTKDVFDDLGPSLWNSYRSAFTNLWIASAFKGASGSNEIVSYVTHYLQNHRSWMSVVAEYGTQFNFQGIIITGWQRYDHFAVLCELLPAGMPALAMCLRLLRGFDESPLSPPTEVARSLKCQQPYALIGPVFGTPKCTFPGGDVLENLIRFQQLRQEFEAIGDKSRFKGWLSEYNVKQCFSNPIYVESIMNSIGRIRDDVFELKLDLSESLGTIYDEFTVREWMDTYFVPFEDQLEILWKAKSKLLTTRVWNRRPLNGSNCDLN
ncbi:unnamed protein product [Phyllotreta striolata]|uniref:beta-N-acetylhexosaminidase n=1 Tax=Phyllotreta striolata TaxID=444603 RepID=A0A9N9TLY6_PHYSR|nr:unnamed protein product [Phyllotreta striolata]